MRVLITRAQDDAETLAKLLEERGHQVLLEPLFSVVPAEGDAGKLIGDLESVQALLFTSANGLRAFAALSDERMLPVFAVGAATAEAARAAGFDIVESAGGDVDDLAALVVERLDPKAGELFHAAGSETAGDLQGKLASAGFEVRRAVLYEARPAERLSVATLHALGAGVVDAVLFFSPRTGSTFVRLFDRAVARPSLRRCFALCLSQAVAAEVAALDWAGVQIAERPDKVSLLAVLERLPSLPALRPEDDKPKEASGAMAETTKTNAPARGDQPAALAVIGAFGGIRPMAGKLGVAVSTVQGWRERGVIPAARHGEIRAAAAAHNVSLDGALLEASGVAAETPVQTPAHTAAKAAPARPAAVQATSSEAAAETSASPPPSAAPDAAQSSSRGGWLGGFLLGAIVLAVGAGGAVLTRDMWAPSVAPANGEALAAVERNLDALRESVAALESRPTETGDGGALAALESRLAALEAAPGGADTGPLEARIAALETRPDTGQEAVQRLEAIATTLDALNGRVATLEAGPAEAPATAAEVAALAEQIETLARELAATAALGERIGAVEARLETMADTATKLEAALAERQQAAAVQRDARTATALAVAVGQLRDTLRSSAPYGETLGLVSGLVGEDAALADVLAPLQAHAETGVATIETLQSAFADPARDAVAAGYGDAEEGLLSGVVRRVSALVTIRPVGEVEGESVGAIVARAEARLRAGDLAACLKQLDALQGASAEAFADWRGRAAPRLAVERALDALSAGIIAKLGG